MFCSKCGNQLPDYARFCNECGNPTVAESVEPDLIRTTPSEPLIQPMSNAQSTVQTAQPAAQHQPSNQNEELIIEQFENHNESANHDVEPKEFCSRCGQAYDSNEMFCSACGEKRVFFSNAPQTEEMIFCSACGTKYNTNDGKCPACGELSYPVESEIRPQKEAALSQSRPIDTPNQVQQTLGGNLLRNVTYKSDGRNVNFYDDHLEFDGNHIRYADIAVMDSHATSAWGYALIVWYSYTTMYLRFTLYNGQKYKINASGMSVWSIGTTRSSKKLWPALFGAAYDIVAKSMAQNVLKQIQSGATVNLAGLEINRKFSMYKKVFKQQPIYINEQNFGACGRDGYAVRVVDKGGQKLFATSDDDPNALLLPYVLNTLYGN